MSKTWLNNVWNSWVWVNVAKSTDTWFLDKCFKWLPMLDTKKQINDVLSNEEDWTEVLEKILSWEYVFSWKWTKGKYTDKYTWYCIYTFVLDKSWIKQDVDVIFYSVMSSKVMIRIDSWYYEILISKHPEILEMISKIYPALPTYSSDSLGLISLVND